MRLIRDKKGFTLVEILVVIALTALVGGATAATIGQLFKVPTRNTSEMTALQEVQKAGYWVSMDVLLAQNVILDDPATPETEFITVNWAERVTSDISHRVAYTLEDSSGGLKELKRIHFANGVEDNTTLVSPHIDPARTSCDWDEVDKVLTLQVTAQVGQANQSGTYQVTPRPLN